jgi:hypothetical protein
VRVRVISASSARKTLAGITFVTGATDAAIAASAKCGSELTKARAMLIRISEVHLGPPMVLRLPILLLRLISHKRVNRGYPIPIRLQRFLYHGFAITADPGLLNLLFI